VGAERCDLEGRRVSLATPKTLFRMKKGTVRPLDHADALRLQRAFGSFDNQEP
jgi:hypothetical protein